MVGTTNGIYHATTFDIDTRRFSSRTALSDSEKDKLDSTIEILKKLQKLYNDPKSDHSLTRQFELWGGSKTGRDFSIPTANKFYNVVQTARESLVGADNTMSKGMADLILETRSFHADTPRWMYAWCPRRFRPYFEPWVKSVTRSFITTLDNIPILKPFTRWRQLRSFFSPVDAKYDMMARASSHCSDVFHRKEAILIGELQDILLTSTEEFKTALVFEMYTSDLHIANQIKEISPDNKLIYDQNITKKIANPPDNEIINGQILKALQHCVDTLVNGPQNQGSTSRAGFLSETTACFLDLPDMLAAYQHGLKTILGEDNAYEAATLDDLSKRNTLITGVPLNVAGIPTLVAIQKRMTREMDAMIQKAQELRNATNPFEYLEPSAARKDLMTRPDHHFNKPWRTIINYRRAMEAREHGYEASVSKQMDALKGQNPNIIAAKPYDDRTYLQKEAASYFLNVLAPIVRQIDLFYEKWLDSKNDSVLEMRTLQYYYTELTKHTAAIVVHSDAFNATGNGALPDDVCRAFGLSQKSTCADLMQRISDKQMKAPSEQEQSRYWNFRVSRSSTTNTNNLDPSMINHRDGQKYAEGLALDPNTKTLVPCFRSPQVKQQFKADAKLHAEVMNDLLLDVAKACKYNAGMLNSTFNIEWPAYIQAMRDVVAKNKNNQTQNWNGKTVVDTPIVYLPEVQIEEENWELRNIRSAHRKEPTHINQSALNNIVQTHRVAAYAGTGRTL